jgi:hypothetical protein
MPSSTAGVRAQGVMGRELVRDLVCERGIEAAANVDRHQFLMLALVVCTEFCALALEVGLLSVCLGVLARSHRHGSRDQAGDPRDHYAAVGPMRSRDTQHQTRCRKDAVIRA